MMLHVLAVVFTIFAGAVGTGSHYKDCPAGWDTISTSYSTTCTWRSDNELDGEVYVYSGEVYVNSMKTAHNKCMDMNTSLVIIDTQEKMKKIKADYSKFRLWIGLQRENGKQQWLTKDGPLPVEYTPLEINWNYVTESSGVIFKDGYFFRRNSNRYSRYENRFLCEMRPACKKGWYGARCDRECHCHDEECDPKADDVKCSYGCQIGWMGNDCSQKKQDAELRYFCVNSQTQGKYAHVIIDTKGVHYDNINPVNEKGDWVSWCNHTVIDQKGNMSTTHIKIYTDNSTDEHIKDGGCAGQVTGTSKYEWRIKIQEYDGLVSRNDQEIHVECDFDEGDKFTLSDETAIKRESQFKKSDVRRPLKYLDEKKELVKLELVDPSKLEPVSEIIIGSPVALRIRFGLNDDSVATGVRPFNCKASSPGGKKSALFLDKNGCPVNSFPISEFHKSGSKTFLTNSFPLFGFENTKEVEFHCDYHLCFGHGGCQIGCVTGDSHDQFGIYRFRRSANIESLSMSRAVKILST